LANPGCADRNQRDVLIDRWVVLSWSEWTPPIALEKRWSVKEQPGAKYVVPGFVMDGCH
jgi:hypothetical protein